MVSKDRSASGVSATTGRAERITRSGGLDGSGLGVALPRSVRVVSSLAVGKVLRAFFCAAVSGKASGFPARCAVNTPWSRCRCFRRGGTGSAKRSRNTHGGSATTPLAGCG